MAGSIFFFKALLYINVFKTGSTAEVSGALERYREGRRIIDLLLAMQSGTLFILSMRYSIQSGWLPHTGPVSAIAVAVAMCVAPVAVTAQEAAMPFHIPAQPLVNALEAFATQSQKQVLFSEETVAGLKAPAVSGRHTPLAALQLLLAGSGIQVSTSDHLVFTLQSSAQSAEKTLGLITVKNAASETTEGTGTYTTDVMRAATGLTLSQRETPQSVSVVTRQQMDDFNLSTIQDVAKNVPGLTVRPNDSNAIFARGFLVQSLNVDGATLSTTNYNMQTISSDMVMYDHVEIVRGAAGLMEGVGLPSASINMVRKRPTKETAFNATASYGSWNNKKLAVDGGGSLNAAGTLRGRLAASWQDTDSFVDVTSAKNQAIYGIVEADLTSRATLGIGASRQLSRTDGVDPGLPAHDDGSHIGFNRSTYLGVADSYFKQYTNTAFTDFTYRFDNDWTLKAVLTHVEGKTASIYDSNSRITGVSPATGLEKSFTGWDYGTRQTVASVTARGPFALWGRKHELALGVSYKNQRSDGAQSWSGSAIPLNVSGWQGSTQGMQGAKPASPFLWQNQSTEKAFYISGNFHLAEPLHLIAGSRFSWYDALNASWSTAPKLVPYGKESAVWVPYVGLTYDLDKQHSVYASYTQIFQPQTAIDRNGQTLVPITGTNYEFGIKGEYFDKQLNTYAAVFLMKQNNRAMSDTSGPNPCPGNLFGGYCSKASGEVQSDGVDIGIAGAVTPDWQLSAGYTYTRTRHTENNDPTVIGTDLDTKLPRQILRATSSYRLPGSLSKWTVLGNVSAQSSVYVKDGSYLISQGKYVVVGLGVGYKLNDQTSIRLNIDNLFDQSYYTGLSESWSGGGDRYGTPRSLMLTLNYRM